MQKRLEARITGRVQLVMYRDFAQRKAKKLGLFGFVKNLKDGSVSVVAEGEGEKLERFIEYLKAGSVLSRVDSVNIAWLSPTEEYKKFVISY